MTGLLGVAVLWKYQGWIVFGIVTYLCYKTWVVTVSPWLRERKLDRQAEDECLRLRADYERREWDEAGIYEGHYPAATMPLTEPMEPRDWYDYDDGFTEWM